MKEVERKERQEEKANRRGLRGEEKRRIERKEVENIDGETTGRRENGRKGKTEVGKYGWESGKKGNMAGKTELEKCKWGKRSERKAEGWPASGNTERKRQLSGKPLEGSPSCFQEEESKRGPGIAPCPLKHLQPAADLPSLTKVSQFPGGMGIEGLLGGGGLLHMQCMVHWRLLSGHSQQRSMLSGHLFPTPCLAEGRETFLLAWGKFSPSRKWSGGRGAELLNPRKAYTSANAQPHCHVPP